MGSKNMFDEGRRKLEEKVFSEEKERKDAEDLAATIIQFLTTLGMSTDDAALVPDILEVVNRAWTITRLAPFGDCLHKVSNCEEDDLACLVEAIVTDPAHTFCMEGYPASCKLNNTQRIRIYGVFHQQGHVDEVVIRSLFEELVEASGFSALSTEHRDLLWNWNRSLQCFSRADVERWKDAKLNKAAGSV